MKKIRGKSMGWKKGRIIDDNGVMKSTTTITIDILFSMFFYIWSSFIDFFYFIDFYK